MAKLTKKQKALEGKADSTKLYPLTDAFGIVKEAATAKFDESIDVAVQLGIDPKKSDQVVRGAVVMPNGTGKTKRVAVFAQGAKAEEAKAAGADIVGMDDLAARVKAGDMPFDVVIAAPDAMRVVGQLGQILGPRGLMPNPKGRHRDARCGDRGEERQGGAGAVPCRQGRDHPRQHRPPLLRDRQAAGQPGRAGGGPQQGQAGDQQGCVSEEDRGLVDHGPGCPRGHAIHLGVMARNGPASQGPAGWWAAAVPGRESGRPSKTVGAPGCGA
jgi:hypothetical protein